MVKNALKSVLPVSWIAVLRAYKHWFFGDPELCILRLLCDPARCSVDVGANVGIYTFFLRKYSSLCHAMEPNPRLAEILRASFPSRVRVTECALSDRNDDVTLSIPVIGDKETPGLASIEPDNPLAETYQVHTTTVSCKILDEMDLGSVGFMKIDVEGHELSVLKGATGVLERDAPSILVEAEERHKPGAVGDLRNFLETCGYQGFFLLNGRLHPIEDFDPERDQNPDHVSSKGKIPGKVYVNNFVFIRDDAVLKRLGHMLTG